MCTRQFEYKKALHKRFGTVQETLLSKRRTHVTDPLVSSLTDKHRDLEERISTELKQKTPDQIKITQMKKEKLRLKEQIENLITT